MIANRIPLRSLYSYAITTPQNPIQVIKKGSGFGFKARGLGFRV